MRISNPEIKRIQSDIVPSASGSYDLGSISYPWENVYANNYYGANGGPTGEQSLVFNDTKAANTDGGTFTSGAWRTRDLNTEVYNTIPNSSLGTEKTVLLLHCDGEDEGITFTDTTGRHTVTPVGDAQTKTAVKKFGTASAYFDGSGDRLTIPNSSDFEFGTGDFTVDCWIRLDSDAPSYVTVISNAVYGAGGFRIIYQKIDNRFAINVGGSSQTANFYANVSGGLTADTWYHIALVRNGSTNTFYLDGASLASYTGSLSTTSSISLSIGMWYYTYDGSWNTPFKGYIDELRVVKGEAKWTSNFTPPNAPYCFTTLLLHCDGADSGTTFTDSTGRHTVTPVGDAQTKTAVKKFGTASAYFDGTGDYLTIPNSEDFNFGTGDFTVDMWIRFAVLGSAGYGIFSTSGTYTDGLTITYGNVGKNLAVYIEGSAKNFSWTPSTDTWYHIAVTRSGTDLRAFVDGTQIGSTITDSTNIQTTNNVNIGGYYGSTLVMLNGYLDEIRVVKGLAQWTANFTVMSEAYNDPTENFFESIGYSNNQFTLPAGTYFIEASAPAYYCNPHKAKLRNITDSEDTLIGSSEISNAVTQSVSIIRGMFTIEYNTTFEIQHQVSGTKATDGFGVASNFGVDEIYTQVYIKRIG